MEIEQSLTPNLSTSSLRRSIECGCKAGVVMKVWLARCVLQSPVVDLPTSIAQHRIQSQLEHSGCVLEIRKSGAEPKLFCSFLTRDPRCRRQSQRRHPIAIPCKRIRRPLRRRRKIEFSISTRPCGPQECLETGLSPQA